MTYGKRLEAAIEQANSSRAALASALGISPQAVGQVITGGRSGNQAFTADNNMRAARFLGVDAFWLATGEGSMTTTELWPFVLVKPEQIQRLTPKHLDMVQKLALDLLEIQDYPIASNSVHLNTEVKGSREGTIFKSGNSRRPSGSGSENKEKPKGAAGSG